jgi:hypothetical protein
MSPHDVAWDALQKEEQAEEEEDFRLWDDEGNLHPEYVSCPTCHGLGYRDETNGYPLHGGETCLHCWGHGVVHRTEEEKRPIDDLMSDFAANPTPETIQSVNQYFAEEPEMVFPEKFSNLMTGEPMDLTWRLLKSGLSFPTDDDDEEKGTPFFDEEFLAHMKEFEKNRSEDEQYTNYVLDAGPHWTLDDRQKRVVEAALNVPDTHPNHNWGKSHYMREETHDMSGHFGHLFDHNSHRVPDHEYDRAVAVINNYAKEIDAHMSNPNADMSEEFMDDITNPEHPWTKALEGYDGPLSTGVTNWQTKNASEPMDIAFQLLKAPDDFDKIQDDIERSKTEGRRSFPEGRKKQRSMGSGSTEEEHEPRERPNARNRAPSLEATEAFYDSLELHPGSRGHEINTIQSDAGPRGRPPEFGTFMPIEDNEWIFEEEAEGILPERPAFGPDDRIQNVALQRVMDKEYINEVPTFSQVPFNPLTGFTRSEPMDLAFRLLKTNDPHEDDYVIEEDLHGDSNQALDNRHIYELMGRIRDDGETHNDIRTTMNRGEKGADTRKRKEVLNQNWLAELEEKNQERFRRGSTYPIYRSEPMDIAMQLLKYEGEEEWLATQAADRQRIEEAMAQHRAGMRDETRSVPCTFCGAGIGEPCIGSPYRSHSARTLALGRKRMGSDKQTGEPMDLAMRLLKESVQTKLPGYDNPRPATTIRRHHERREGG